MGGIVEAFVEGDEVHSPSVQMRVTPSGELVVVSTHDQVLGGATGQVYLGCLAPVALPPARRTRAQLGPGRRELGGRNLFADSIEFLLAELLPELVSIRDLLGGSMTNWRTGCRRGNRCA